MNIHEIIKSQKSELESRLQEKYIEREVSDSLFQSKLIKVIIGPRRAGKSFFAVHHLKRNKDSFGYMNFDDERLADISDISVLVDSCKVVYDNPKCLLLDEIQNVPRWELAVNRLYREGYDLVVTGSNAHLLSRELATHLTGRHIPVFILPFSFSEYLKTSSETDVSDARKSALLMKYMESGGYPEIVTGRSEMRQYSSALFNSIIYRDIIKRANIRLHKGIENLALYLLSNIASEYSYNNLTRMTSCSSVRTVEKFLGYLEEAFLLFSIRRFSFKLKEQMSFNKKIYCVDNGLISGNAFSNSPNYGKLFENLIAIELKKRELEKEIELFFWKNRQNEEVDFVVRKNLKVESLIQACFNIDNPETKSRESRALLKASKELKCENLFILTQDYEAEEELKWFDLSGKIKFIPLWKWLNMA
jgi:predicted AAA+ superfamily ATPase